MGLDRFDYEEPRCPFETDFYKEHKDPVTVDMYRVLAKLDEYLSREDYASAESHMKLWLTEAKSHGDIMATVAILSELMGLMRKLSRRDDAYRYVEEAIEIVEANGLGDTVVGATAYLNGATVRKAFSEDVEALSMYRRAESVYQETLEAHDYRLAGLYNNMAVTLSSLREYAEAVDYYSRAKDILSSIPTKEPEIAITCLNIADTLHEWDEERYMDEIDGYVDEAERILESDIPWDGNYAFVCSKCASAFRYHGRFMYARELMERARSIYERN